MSHPSTTPPLSASVVLFHSDSGALRETLTAFADACADLKAPVALWVVDQSLNRSYSTETESLCRALLSDHGMVSFEFIRADSNRGYGGGHNRVLNMPLGRYHLILNPDVVMGRKALVNAMVACEGNPDIALLAPRGWRADGSEDFLAKRFPSASILFLRAYGGTFVKNWFRQRLAHYEYRDLPASPDLHPVLLTSGCCMLVRTDALRAVGGFDERFFMYFEDYDLSLRLARQGRVMRLSTMEVTHKGGEAAAKGVRHIFWFTASAFRFFSIWGWR